MLVARRNYPNFTLSPLPYSVAPRGTVSLQGLGCVACEKPGLGGLTDFVGGVNLQTVLLAGLAGFVVYRLLFGSGARQRRSELRSARSEYEAKRRDILRRHPRGSFA